MPYRIVISVWIVIVWILLSGCSDVPERVSAPSWQPEELADRVIEQLDVNGDSMIDEKEVRSSPGLAFASGYLESAAQSYRTAGTF